MTRFIDSIRGLKNGQSPEPIGGPGRSIEDRSVGDDDSSDGLSKYQMFEILRNSRRRAVFSILRTRGGELSVKELSTRVAAREYDVPPAELSPEQYKRVYTGLYQHHLEKMANMGVIDFDKAENIVRLHEVASQFAPYLDGDQRLGAGRIEFGIAVTVASIVILGATGIGPFDAVSPTLLGSVTIVALLGLAILQPYGLQ